MNDTNTPNNKEDENIGSFYMGRTRPAVPPTRTLPRGMLLTTVAFFIFAGIIWFAYPNADEKYNDADIPVIKADTSPIKIEPIDPGGMEVPHQDSTVFEPLEKNAGTEVERLMPMQEEPINKDVEIKAAEAVPPVTVPAPETTVAAPEAPPAPTAATPLAIEEEKPAIKEEPKAEVKTETKPAAKPTATTGNVSIQLSSFRDVEAAKKDWQRLTKKHPDLFAGMEMKTERADIAGKGIYYRLQAGKVDAARAKEICAALKAAKSAGCIIVKK